MEHKLIAKNTIYQILNRLVTSGIGFLITIIIAKNFGVEGFGDFIKVTAFVGLFYLIADFGLNAVFLQKENASFSNLLFLRLTLSILLVILVNVFSFFLPFNSSLNLGFSEIVKIGILIFSLTIIIQAVQFSANAIFQKNLKFDFLMKAGIIGSLITLGLMFIFTYFSTSLYYVFLSFVIGGLITAALSLYWTKQKINLSFDFSVTKKLVIESLPLGLMLIFNLIYFRIDILLLSIFKPTADVGIYGLSYKFFDFLVALPLFLSNSLYPFFIKWGNNSRSLLNFLKNYFFVFLFSSLLLVVIFWFAAPYISLIREDFAGSVIPFRILILSLPLFFLTSLLQWILISQKKQKHLMLIYFFCAILNIVLNIIFIPKYSYIASAIITGVSEFVVFIFLSIMILKITKNTQNRN